MLYYYIILLYYHYYINIKLLLLLTYRLILQTKNVAPVVVVEVWVNIAAAVVIASIINNVHLRRKVTAAAVHPRITAVHLRAIAALRIEIEDTAVPSTVLLVRNMVIRTVTETRVVLTDTVAGEWLQPIVFCNIWLSHGAIKYQYLMLYYFWQYGILIISINEFYMPFLAPRSLTETRIATVTKIVPQEPSAAMMAVEVTARAKNPSKFDKFKI